MWWCRSVASQHMQEVGSGEWQFTVGGDTEVPLGALQSMGNKDTFARCTHLREVGFELVRYAG